MLLVGLLSGCSCGEAPRIGRLFQVTFLQSLMQAECDGVVMVGELKGYGAFEKGGTIQGNVQRF